MTRRSVTRRMALGTGLLAVPWLSACEPSDGIARHPVPAPHGELPPLPPPAAGSVFPLRIESGRSCLVDATGRPFLLIGDTAWSLLAQLSREQIEHYLVDRRSRGYNAVLVNVLESHYARRPPLNSEGHAPFESPPRYGNVADYVRRADFDTPRLPYFELFDFLLDRAAAHGLLVMATPCYPGYEGGEQGWWVAMKRNGAAKLRSYGRFLGRRYRDRTNLLWVQGGDFNVPDRALVHEMAEGIREYDARALHTFHAGRGTGAHDWMGDAKWLSLGNIYTGEVVYEAALQHHATRPGLPFILIEAYYEKAKPDPRLTRVAAYQAMLSGACGQLSGHFDVWQFNPEWEAALDSVTARSISQLARLFTGRRWWDLVPDSAGQLLRGERGSGMDRVVAAVARDGSFAIAYVPTRRAVEVSLTGLAAEQVAARWIDPILGTEVRLPPIDRRTRHTLVLETPGRNALALDDWVLLLERSV